MLDVKQKLYFFALDLDQCVPHLGTKSMRYDHDCLGIFHQESHETHGQQFIIVSLIG